MKQNEEMSDLTKNLWFIAFYMAAIYLFLFSIRPVDDTYYTPTHTQSTPTVTVRYGK